MPASRLALALQAGLFELPESGMIVACGAVTGQDLSDLPRERVVVVSPLATDHAIWRDQGIAAVTEMPQSAALSIVFLTRSKVLGRGLIAAAVARTTGPVVIDGQKTDGTDGILKDLRQHAAVSEVLSKTHGKIFALWAASDALADWALPEAPLPVPGGFVTLPGVFSADAVDPASALLASVLPDALGARVADLGAGWGYLSAQILTRADVKELHLVENDSTALACARLNVADPRARFHWADATRWRPDAALDCVVMNPPFHAARAADPDLGRAFIAAAAACLSPRGRLYMVANRHLPYEAALATAFTKLDEVAGNTRFKVLAAQSPARQQRAHRLV